MMSNTKFNSYRAAILGALNGLLFGVPIEMLRVWYADIEISRLYELERQTGELAPSVVNLGFQTTIPLLCALVFALSSYLVHRFRTNHPRSLLLRWQFIGFVGVTGCTILNFVDRPYIWRLQELAWEWVVCLAVVVPINFIFGMIVESSALLHSQGKES